MAVALLAAMFTAFLIQIFTRYVINYPLGWTLEVCVTTWLWLVFWGAAFIVEERDHVRFDVLYQWVGNRTRRIFALVSAAALLAGFAASFPASIDYITFYKIKKSTVLGIRLDIVFSVYALFAAAVILRSAVQLVQILRGRPLESHEPDEETPII